MQDETIRKLEEMSAAFLSLARNASDAAEIKSCESVSAAYEHAADIVRGTDQAGPGYEKARDDLGKWLGSDFGKWLGSAGKP